MLRTMMTRRPGAGGTKKLMREYGARLVCVRYRYDEERNERIKTVELEIDRVPSKPRARPSAADAPIDVRLREGEDLLRRALLLAGCRYDAERGTWSVPPAIAKSLGLLDRSLRHTSRPKRTEPHVVPKTHK